MNNNFSGSVEQIDGQELDKVNGGYTLIELLPARPQSHAGEKGPEKQIDLVSWSG